jgi:acetylglutamate kinase
VHGGGKAVDSLLKRLNMSVERREGLRVTPDDQIALITGVLAGTVNKQLVAAINTATATHTTAPTPKAIGLCLGDAGLCRCVKLTRTPSGVPVDLGRVGEVASGDPRVITALLRQNFIPVISSIGIDDAGGLLNINADDAAAALASILHASRLVLLTDVTGVRAADGIVRPTLNAAQISAMIASGEISGGMIPKVRSALAVAQSTRAPVVILSGESADHLANHLAGQSVGTTILPD